jgi:hypothetical protein
LTYLFSLFLHLLSGVLLSHLSFKISLSLLSILPGCFFLNYTHTLYHSLSWLLAFCTHTHTLDRSVHSLSFISTLPFSSNTFSLSP